jgi:RNA polymerase sigma-70 factor (ECF subfamily)
MESECVLLQLARDFDEQALAEVYDRYSPELYRYAWRLLGDEDQAEDCVAETFERFLRALLNGGGPQQNLRAYLYRAAHNWIIDRYRQQPAMPLPLREDLHSEGWNDPPQRLDEILARDEVRHALAALTPDQRQVIVLRFLQDLENFEVAQALEKPIGAVKALQHRALASLRRMLCVQEERPA